MPLHQRSPRYTEDVTFVESIRENSCRACNELTAQGTREEDPLLLLHSTCHDFQCRKVGRKSTSERDDVLQPESTTLTPLLSNVLDFSAINDLPEELLDTIFEYLDSYSLYCAAKVCTGWRDRIQRTKKCQKLFERTFDERWTPQFRKIYPVMDYHVFSKLVDSVNCKSCFVQEPEKNRSIDKRVPLNNSGANLGVRRLNNDLKGFPCEGADAIPLNDKTTKLIGRIQGPKYSPFENGIFYLTVSIENIRYPFRAPEIRFLTKIFHPAISCHGHISVDFLGSQQWTPSCCLPQLFLSIQSLLTDTDFELCEHTPIGKLYRENKAEYERIARIWTEKFAMQHLIHPPPVPAPPLPGPIPPPLNDI